jgi:hypothetical protein
MHQDQAVRPMNGSIASRGLAFVAWLHVACCKLHRCTLNRRCRLHVASTHVARCIGWSVVCCVVARCVLYTSHRCTLHRRCCMHAACCIGARRMLHRCTSHVASASRSPPAAPPRGALYGVLRVIRARSALQLRARNGQLLLPLRSPSAMHRDALKGENMLRGTYIYM